jgi:CBS domain containing-hemolysin-like protein
MDSDFILSLILFGLLLLFSAFFSGSEVAFFSLQPAERRRLEGSPSMLHTLVLRLLKNPGRLLNTVLVGNTIVNIGAAITAASMALGLATKYNLPSSLVILIEIVVVTLVLLILSEVTPKIIAIKHPLSFASVAAIPISILTIAFLPVTIVLQGLNRLVHRFLEPLRSKSDLTLDDVQTLADVGGEHGALHDMERTLLRNIARLQGITVRHIMVARVDMVALDVMSSPDAILAAFEKSKLSRIPVYEGSNDNVIGILYAKDVLAYLTPEGLAKEFPLRELLKPPLLVPESKSIPALLHEFRSTRRRMAIVLDEYGGVAGLVTLKDVMDEVAGEGFGDESIQTPDIRPVEDGSFVMSGSITLDRASEVLGVPLADENTPYTTIGGLVLSLAESLPEANQEFKYKDLRLRVLSIEKRRIRRVRVFKEQTSEV